MNNSVIYKYPLEKWDYGVFELALPVAARVLCVQVQRGVPTVWARVNPAETEIVPRRFVVVATGAPAPSQNQGNYIGTFQLLAGDLVFHLFEMLRQV
jgi:hypothetical protein